jgi:hypothetical protein
VLVDNGS